MTAAITPATFPQKYPKVLKDCGCAVNAKISRTRPGSNSRPREWCLPTEMRTQKFTRRSNGIHQTRKPHRQVFYCPGNKTLPLAEMGRREVRQTRESLRGSS